ncbi:Uncharacterized protein dnm_040520 [Desulfonema magnum]|uniref:Uncharacterized protein n=1 Tax=Desulfonema magnum TaxID=45655 RepID=A0A975BLZ8_9BACT|nr:Uncharacterized protein dnm_040520 [Desulfonema magnum]
MNQKPAVLSGMQFSCRDKLKFNYYIKIMCRRSNIEQLLPFVKIIIGRVLLQVQSFDDRVFSVIAAFADLGVSSDFSELSRVVEQNDRFFVRTRSENLITELSRSRAAGLTS